MNVYSSVISKKVIKVLLPQSHYRYLRSSVPNNATEQKSEADTVRAEDILEDLKTPELTEEQILQKRFKSRLPERIYKIFVQKEAFTIENKYDFELPRLQKYWARFGHNSKLNPGICWPTREQILKTIELEKIFEPPLQERLRRVEEERLNEQQKRLEYEAVVEKNMADHDKWLADYYAKNQKKEDKARQLKLDREKLVEEICEYLGYDIDPKDPRFKEAVMQRDKEKKKAQKVKKQQESYEKMLEKLKKIAQQKT